MTIITDTESLQNLESNSSTNHDEMKEAPNVKKKVIQLISTKTITPHFTLVNIVNNDDS
jgi:hypothetical protein